MEAYPQGNQIERLLIAPYTQHRLKNLKARAGSLDWSQEYLDKWANVAQEYVRAIWDWSRDPDLLGRVITLPMEDFERVVQLWQLQVSVEAKHELWNEVVLDEYQLAHPSWTNMSVSQLSKELLFDKKWNLLKQGLSPKKFAIELRTLIEEQLDLDSTGLIDNEDAEFEWWQDELKLPRRYKDYPGQWKMFRDWIHNELPTKSGDLPAKILRITGAAPIRPFLNNAIVKIVDPTQGRIIRFWDLFAGAGGFTNGAVLAGLTPVFALEWDADAAATYRANWPNADVYVGAIEEWLADIKNGNLEIERPDLIIGGPPCQGFSGSGLMQGVLFEGHRVPQMTETIHLARPTAFALENVAAMGEKRFKSEVERVVRSLTDVGYTVTTGFVNPLDYGIPQNRERFFIVGSLEGEFYFPGVEFGDTLRPDRPYAPASTIGELFDHKRFGSPNAFVPTFSKMPTNPETGKSRWGDVEDAFYMSNIAGNKYLRALDWDGYMTHSLTRGTAQDWFDTKDKGYEYWCELSLIKQAKKTGQDVRERAKTWNITWDNRAARKDAVDRTPCPNTLFKRKLGTSTIARKTSHIPGASCLSWAECATLQGFPPNYNWRPEAYPNQPQKSSIFGQIGNAVPSVLGLYIGRALIEQELV